MNDSLHIPVDLEHSGLRGAVLGAFVFGSAAVCGLTTLLFPNVGIFFAAIAGIALGVGGAALLERTLKGRWLSGRELNIDAAGIRLIRKGAVESAIDPSAQVTVLRWRFQSRARRRIPKGWFVIAFAIAADDTTISVYTLMSPQAVEAMPGQERFKTLTPPAKSGSASEDMRLAGEQRRLHEAEIQRWQNGAEVTNADFTAILARVDAWFG
jgi:hypothetical protein